jgi:shikimate dehydrogenase
MTSAKRFVLLGHPVAHSVSPAIHQAVYAQLRWPHRYEAVDCPDRASVERQLRALRDGELAGANVTVPHKLLALELADRVDPSAQATGAANVLRLESDEVVAHNTDAPALAKLVRMGARRAGCEQPAQALVLGTGGAALAAVVACSQAGIQSVFVSGRRWLNSSRDWPRQREFERLGAQVLAWEDDHGAPCVSLLAPDCDVIIQASSAGMLGVGNGESVTRVIPWRRLSPTCFVYDVVYNPPRTPFLDAAREVGLEQEGGLSMLVGQAALAVNLWLGQAPDEAAMMAAAERAMFDERRT